jgi:hypothetical protein
VHYLGDRHSLTFDRFRFKYNKVSISLIAVLAIVDDMEAPRSSSASSGAVVALPEISGEVSQQKQTGRTRRLEIGAIMFAKDLERPFESIESAHDYMNLLADTILEVTSELHRDREHALRAGEQRRAQAVDLAIFKLKMLNCYVFKSRRALNDLRILRRLILNERLSVESVMAAL